MLSLSLLLLLLAVLPLLLPLNIKIRMLAASTVATAAIARAATAAPTATAAVWGSQCWLLHHFVHAGDRKRVQLLLQHGLPADKHDSHSLVSAAFGVGGTDAQRASLCKLLIRHGADPKAQDSKALVDAASMGRRLTCEALVAAGADKGAVSNRAVSKVKEAMRALLAVEGLEQLLYSNMLTEGEARMFCGAAAESLGKAQREAQRVLGVARGPAPWQPSQSQGKQAASGKGEGKVG